MTTKNGDDTIKYRKCGPRFRDNIGKGRGAHVQSQRRQRPGGRQCFHRVPLSFRQAHRAERDGGSDQGGHPGAGLPAQLGGPGAQAAADGHCGHHCTQQRQSGLCRDRVGGVPRPQRLRLCLHPDGLGKRQGPGTDLLSAAPGAAGGRHSGHRQRPAGGPL